jgi:tetratricopeptide (TPR) repeat protein
LCSLAEEIVDHLDLSRRQIALPSSVELQKDSDLFSDRVLSRVYQAIGGKDIVVLMDEFDVLSDHSFSRFLQQAIQRHKGLFVIPVVGRHLEEIPSLLDSFGGAPPNRRIGLLDKQSATRLITQPAKGILEYGNDAIQAILELTSGHPYFTQLLCHAIFARAREEEEFLVTRADVKAVVDKAIEGGEAGLVWFRDGLPVVERVIFSAVAEVPEIALQGEGVRESAQGGSPRLEFAEETLWRLLEERGIMQTERLRQAKERLVEWGFLQAVEPRRSLEAEALDYKVIIELARRWLVRRHPLRQAMWELEDADAKAARIYREAAQARKSGSVSKAIELYEQVLKANPNHFRALIERAETCLEADRCCEAVELYTRAHKVDPTRTRADFARALVGCGRTLTKGGDFELASSHFTQALELEADNELAREGLAEAQVGLRRALAVQNPFTVGTPVPTDRFVGRGREISEILSLVSAGGHVAVHGERRIGKTSLLRYMAFSQVWQRHDPTFPRPWVVYVDCMGAMPFSPERFWQLVLWELEEQAERDKEIEQLVDDLQSSSPLGVRSLLRLLRTFRDRERRLVLLLDEFEVTLVRDELDLEEVRPELLAQLRTIIREPALSVVVATRRPFPEYFAEDWEGSPLSNMFSSLRLGPFDEFETRALLSEMPSAFALSDEERSWVRQVGGGFPYLLQAALYVLFQFHAEDLSFDVEDATEALSGRMEAFFSEIWDDACNEESGLLALIAIGNLGQRIGRRLYDFDYEAVVGRYERALSNLEERGLVIRGEQEWPYRYALSPASLEWWIVSEIEALDEEDVEKWTERFSARSPDHRLTRQFRTAIRRIQRSGVAGREPEAWMQPPKRR